MAEQDMSQLKESMHESVVGKAVRGAVERAQQKNQEYWRIRKAIKDGPSSADIYRKYVHNMDRLLHFKYGDLGNIGKIAEFTAKLKVRLEAVAKIAPPALADFFINSLTWAPRKILGIDAKSQLKRLTDVHFSAKLAAKGVEASAVRASTTAGKVYREAGAAILTAPAVALHAGKEKVGQVMDWMKNPFRVEAKGPMKLKH